MSYKIGGRRASDITSGEFANARISDSSVTQHETELETALEWSQMGAAVQDVSMGTNYKLTNMADPSSDQDAATKHYVDEQIETLSTGLDWQDSVKDQDLTAPPGGPSAGDRYIVGASASGAWSGHDYKIAEYNGSSWDITSVSDGMSVFIEDENLLYMYDSGTGRWKKIGSFAVNDFMAASNNLSDVSNASTARTNLGLAIGSDVQAYDADLANLSGFAPGSSAALALLTADEIGILDGATVSTAELNILDGVTSTAAELNVLDGVTASTAELNILDGVTATAAELNILDGVTASAAELNKLDGVTTTTAQLNYVDGVTSGIQAQLDNKQALDGDLTDIAGLSYTSGNAGKAVGVDESGNIALIKSFVDTELMGSVSITYNRLTSGSAYTCDSGSEKDYVVMVDDSIGAAFTVTLPTVASGDEGRVVVVKAPGNASSHNVTVTGATDSGVEDYIDNSADFTLDDGYQAITLVYTGDDPGDSNRGNWAII